MTDNGDKDKKEAVLLAQYQQVCEDYRHCDTLAWQIPSLITAIGGALIVVSFGAMATAPIPARVLVLGIALMLIVGMSFILLRHRYFQAITVGTLSRIEEELKAMHVQRTPFPREYDELVTAKEMYPKGLLYAPTPGNILKHGTPGPKLLFRFMMTMALGVVAMMVWTCIAPGKLELSCVERYWAWGVFVGFIIATIVMVLLVKKRENKDIAEEAKKRAKTGEKAGGSDR